MLRVPTYLAPSAIEGFGLFAACDIPAGTVVWEYTPGVDLTIRPSDVQSLPEALHRWFLRYAYLDESGDYVLCGDGGKFMNHSFHPNCDDGSGPCTVAIRDIAEGEELTCDYRLFDRDILVEELSRYR